MTGSDTKHQKRASVRASSDGGKPLVVQDPDVSHFVMQGVPQGLIPRAKLDSDQTTTITTWDGTLPTNPGFSEKFRLQIARRDSNEWTTLKEHIYVGGTAWAPLDFTIPSTFLLDPLNEGLFDLRYEHENFLDVSDESNRVQIVIDKIPPNNGLPPKPMEFTVSLPITDASFAGNDYIEATIPLWEGDLLDVKIIYAWIKGELPAKPEDLIPVAPPADVKPGEKIKIYKTDIEKAGDGLCTGGYILIDKAGNPVLSGYELMSVALGALPPTPLPEPLVADSTGGELLREDIINGGVIVNVPKVTNGKSTDIVVVKWKDKELLPGTPVGANPSTGIDIFVPWDMILDAYGSTTTGVVGIPVSYTVVRGVEPYLSAIETKQCNLSTAGPVNPKPEPGNPALKEATVVGKSGVNNVLIDSDEDEKVEAKIELVAPLTDGDTYQVMWNGAPNGAPYVIDTTDPDGDKEGGVINIELDWDVIREAGPSATMPVWYELTNSAHVNPQEPETHTSVEIDFLVFTLPQAEALHTNAAEVLTCNSLRWDAAQTVFGIEYRIPPSTHLKEGDEVVVTWKAFTNFDSPTEVGTAEKTATFTNITKDQADKGIVWLIEPYATHVLPTWVKATPIGKGEVSYTIKDKPASSVPTNTMVGLSQGETSCNVPPPKH